jgi:hypothetical protein
MKTIHPHNPEGVRYPLALLYLHCLMLAMDSNYACTPRGAGGTKLDSLMFNGAFKPLSWPQVVFLK